MPRTHKVYKTKLKRTGLPQPDGNRYAQYLCYFQTQKKMTMEEVAQKSGVALSRIRMMEHGELPVTGDECRRLANVLSIKPEEIHNDTPGTIEVVLLPEGKLRPPLICNWCRKAHEGEGCNPEDIVWK